MYIRKLSALVSLIALLTVFFSDANAKSIYAIIDHGYRPDIPVPAKIAAYGIDSNQIEWQTTSEFNQDDYPTGGGAGPVGVAIDSDSGHMFVTHESMDFYGFTIKGIQIIRAKSMTDLGWIEAQGASDLAGIVYDHDKKKVYTVDRNSDDLFVYNWNPQNKTLTL